jgi:alanyl-tRNA synthetase
MIKSSADIRQSFLDFFRSKKHTIVPSSSLLPDSPNLLFTNAGMNQFVPIFLGQRAPDVSKWPGVVPGSDTRAADTQKCIRAGGKHNDLEDVGLDTYHHTFFEMLGNWSFGDYFKKEAIEWAWELITEVWKFPKNRLYATVYSPDRSKGDPSDFDQEAHDIWAEKFHSAGLDPKIHIVNGNKKDNFWMMGDTGPCGPCSEIHVDLTPNGDTKGSLVNKGDARCIEIWNLVFIQFNANPDGSFSPLPAKHVDTGMGFERVTGIIQNTNGFKDFSRIISNYETDIFRPLFNKIEELSGKKYKSTLPPSGSTGTTEQEKIDVAFRVIADHIRTLSFSIADGIIPSNEGRGYVLRRILRRAVRYGRALDFHEPFFYKLVAVLGTAMGQVFPEIRSKQAYVEEIIQREEEAFNKTLDNGIVIFNVKLNGLAEKKFKELFPSRDSVFGVYCAGVLVLGEKRAEETYTIPFVNFGKDSFRKEVRETVSALRNGLVVPGDLAFELYDTYGFPLDLTELMARERGLAVDVAGFNKLMEEQKAKARAAQKKEVIELKRQLPPTQFVGYELLETECLITDFETLSGKENGEEDYVIVDKSTLYADMGGQVGDSGEIERLSGYSKGFKARIIGTIKKGNSFLLQLDPVQRDERLKVEFSAHRVPKDPAVLRVDRSRRFSIQRHHTVTHLLHWALHEVVSKDAVQKGSYVGPEKLTFDFSSAPLTPQQIADVEKLVNERILENAGVSWTEVPYSEVKSRKDVMQLFGEKYAERVRVVQIGGKPTALDGYSMELCGGTHTRATGEIGLFRIVAESATGAGIRRIEAVAGLEAYKQANEQLQLIKTLAGKINTPVTELEKKIDSLLTQQKDLEKQLKASQQKQAAETARTLTAKAQTIGSTRAIIEKVTPADGDYLQSIADSLKGQFNGVVVLGGSTNGAVALVATVSPDLTKQIQAGKIIQTIAPIVGGKGGGRPDNARGGGKEVAKLDEALAKAKSLLG